MSFYCYMNKKKPESPALEMYYIEMSPTGEMKRIPIPPPLPKEYLLRHYICDVQPMTLPSAQVFYTDFQYDSKWERFKRWFKRRVKAFLWLCFIGKGNVD